MKFLVTFFLCISIHFFGGSAIASAASNAGIPAAHAEAGDIAGNTFKTTLFLQTVQAGFAEEQVLLVGVEDENDNEETLRKHVLFAKYFAAFSNAFIATYGQSARVAQRPSLLYQASCKVGKYISQRTLRL